MSTPATKSFRMSSSEELAGPSVATILALRVLRIIFPLRIEDVGVLQSTVNLQPGSAQRGRSEAPPPSAANRPSCRSLIRRREDSAGWRLQAAFFLVTSPILAVTSFTAVVKLV